MLSVRHAAAIAALAFVAGCGGTTSLGDTIDAASSVDGAARDAAREGASADASCLAPTVGAACAAGEVACQPTDPCCAGYLWACGPSTHVWEKAGLGCACINPVDSGADADAAKGEDAGPFACGPRTCSSGAYCTDTTPGVRLADGGAPPDSFACSPVPASCATTPTCACIGASFPAGDVCSTRNPGVTCAEDGGGHVTLHCQGI